MEFFHISRVYDVNWLASQLLWISSAEVTCDNTWDLLGVRRDPQLKFLCLFYFIFNPMEAAGLVF